MEQPILTQAQQRLAKIASLHAAVESDRVNGHWDEEYTTEECLGAHNNRAEILALIPDLVREARVEAIRLCMNEAGRICSYLDEYAQEIPDTLQGLLIEAEKELSPNKEDK